MRRCNLLRRLAFSSLHIIRALLRSLSSRNTVAEAAQAVAQAVVVDTAVAPEAAQVVAPEAGRAALVELAEGRVGPEAALAEPAGARARQEEVRAPVGPASAVRIAILHIIRRGRLFRNFPRRLLPISRECKRSG